MNVELYGYQYSVYSWIARLALEEKGVSYHWIEINPFAPDVPESYLALTPSSACRLWFTTSFRSTKPARSRVTSTRHSLALASSHRPAPSRPLQPVSLHHRQLRLLAIGAAGIFPSRLSASPGRPSDATEIQKGLDAAPEVLAALERLVADTEYLCGTELSLADIHLAPMIGYFAMAGEGEALLKRHRKLSHWWATISARTAYRATMPRLPV